MRTESQKILLTHPFTAFGTAKFAKICRMNVSNFVSLASWRAVLDLKNNFPNLVRQRDIGK
jgi:hypothetical protein